MSAILEQFRFANQPRAQEAALLCFDNIRITLLTERLLRLEYQPQARFEDRASQAMWFREQTVPDFTVNRYGMTIEIETAFLRLCLKLDSGEGFSPDNLSIYVKATDTNWQPNAENTGNLRGTTRTLDFVNGYTALGEGLMSRSGWALLDDSASFVFNEDYWLTPRPEGAVDWYFFGYGLDYKACLQDYCKISGAAPLIPRWILGNWWSRYWAYRQEELMGLIKDFQAHEIPLSVCIIDMDWHITKTGNSSSGWTGYTWNKELFPNPQDILDFLHVEGLKTSLNLHPADGVYPHEEQYPEMARRLGIDPESGESIPFDITNPEFAKAYFELLHHPHEAMGVDFWWVDWQQGQKSRVQGLDPLWLINHLHFQDSGRNLERRPFVFSRWGNQGHQRYPIGFSGDSYITWDSLRFQPYMTATASNVAYGWWSHDIGGHISGVGSPELFIRWVQFGILSPIMRVHSGNGHFYDRRPWIFEDSQVLDHLRTALQLRHQFLPYLYTMAYRAHRESLPLMLPIYYDYPEAEAAYHSPQEYLFGSELIAAPFTEPLDPHTQLSRQVVYLPEGTWTHFFTGEQYEGNRHYAIYGTLGEIPLFAKAGAIIPLGDWDNLKYPEKLVLHIFAGATYSFTLYEDDGESRAYQEGQYALTTIRQDYSEKRLVITLQAAEGDSSVCPAERLISFAIHGLHNDLPLLAKVDGQTIAVTSRYDASSETSFIENLRVASASNVQIIIESAEKPLLVRRDRQGEKVLKLLKHFRLHAGVRNKMAAELQALLANPLELARYALTMQESQARALAETLFEAGVHVVKDTLHPTLILLWNNRQDAQISYRYSDAYLYFDSLRFSHHHEGVAPAFMAIIPPAEKWTHGAQGEHVQRTQWSAQIDYHNILSVNENYKEQTP